MLGIFRSTNGGRSWKEILDGRFPNERQMDYNNTIAVHPRRPDSVIWGGMKLHRTDNAGRNWRTITKRDRGARNYVHDDHHALLWPDDDLILSGNDGGVSVSHDGGRTWQERSRRMVTTMFYDLDVAPSNGKIFGGGTQDNGTVIAGVDGMPEGDCVSAIGGDGAWTAFDPADAEIAFASSSGFDIRRHVRGQPWKDLAGWKFISPGPDEMPDGERFQRSFTVLAIDPSTRKGPRRLWAGSARLWSWDTQRRRWMPPSHVFDGSPISAIEISEREPACDVRRHDERRHLPQRRRRCHVVREPGGSRHSGAGDHLHSVASQARLNGGRDGGFHRRRRTAGSGFAPGRTCRTATSSGRTTAAPLWEDIDVEGSAERRVLLGRVRNAPALPAVRRRPTWACGPKSRATGCTSTATCRTSSCRTSSTITAIGR